MGVSIKTVEEQIRRGNRLLREKLADYVRGA